MRGVLGAGIVVLSVWVRLTCADVSPSDAVCRPDSVRDLILGFRDYHCLLHGDGDSIKFVGVQEGDEALLHRALRLVQKNHHEYVAVLFYASRCPFSRAFKPNFSLLSSLYPSIHHFSIEESALRPSTLSKYGVHGFPTLYLLNSTMRINYHGSRNLSSLGAFYKEVTGMESRPPLEGTTLEEIKDRSNLGRHGNVEEESCPFWWAIPPENFLQQETYLALATSFVLMRLIYFLYPTLLVCGGCALDYLRNMNLLTLENFLGYLQQVFQPGTLKEKGAMNARVWASKSLATVSIGEASTSRRLE